MGYKNMKKDYKIDNEIYKQDIIKQAIIDFSDVAKIKYNEWNLIIQWENKLEIDEIFNEFSNYIIWLYNEQ